MRIQQKQINYLLLFSLFILLFHPTSINADSDKGKGKMKIKSDRILKEQSDDYFGETELDKRFPNLFSEEINHKIHEKQRNDDYTLDTLKKSVLIEDIPERTMLTTVKSALFTEEYTASNHKRRSAEDAEEHRLTSSVLFYGSLGFIIGLIICILFVLLRKFRTEG